MKILAVVRMAERPGEWFDVAGAAHAAAEAVHGTWDAALLAWEEEEGHRQARELWRAGAEQVWVAVEPSLRDPDADQYTAAITELGEMVPHGAILLRGDSLGAEAGPRAAWRLQAGCVTDVVGVRRGPEGHLLWVRSMYGGKAVAAVRVNRPTAVGIVRPHAFPAPPHRAGDPGPDSIRKVSLSEWVRAARSVRVLERRTSESSGPRLEEARVVVAGGRGVGGPEGFQMLQELAGLVGGAVGASRAAVDAGWAPGHLQIGQTGKKIAPEVYIAVGISGASQHLAGVSGARHIVAINTDPEAPIFRAAEIGVVEDWKEIVPRLIRRLRESS